jgi:cyclophilin family peptidyl-prolyl cis-trans isomerase
MDIKKLAIILLISAIIAGGSYFAWNYYCKQMMPPIPVKVIKNDETFKNIDETQQPVNFEDTNSQPYFDISIGDEHIGRVVFQLFDEEVPKTCKNFRYLCTNGLLNKNKPSYEGTLMHRIIKDFMIQGGDITRGDGTGGYSIYGEHFDDENFNLTHNQPGMLSMANAGPNTNNSQFFITLKKTPWLDNKHVVFGIIISGFDIIKKMEEMETGSNDKPLENVSISKCGLIFPEKN